MSLNTLDLLIGLVVVYLMLSLVLAAFREAIEARLKSRARHLALGIMQMLNSREDARRLYNSPLISALYRPDSSTVVNAGMTTEEYASFGDAVALPPADFKGFSGFSAPWLFFCACVNRPKEAELPSYIPARIFARGLVALALDKAELNAAGGQAQAALKKVDLQTFSEALDALALDGCDWAKSLRVVIASAADDFDTALHGIEDWYDGAMDRVSGWYRRESHFISFWMGLVLAVGLNVDSIFLAKHLASDDSARGHLVALVAKYQSEFPRKERKDQIGDLGRADTVLAEIAAADQQIAGAIKDFGELALPIGWSDAKLKELNYPIKGSAVGNWIQALIGWFITALALSLGAPFWFDILNKIMVIRSTVKPREKSPEESSEDRQK